MDQRAEHGDQRADRLRWRAERPESRAVRVDQRAEHVEWRVTRGMQLGQPAPDGEERAGRRGMGGVFPLDGFAMRRAVKFAGVALTDEQITRLALGFFEDFEETRALLG